MARGTRLFQAPRSPLIQGRSRTVRPWWQPYAASVLLGLAWPVASGFPLEIAGSGAARDAGAVRNGAEAPGVWEALEATLTYWLAGAWILVPSVLVGAAIGVGVGGMWGTRYRWVPGALGAVGTWYAALVVVGLLGW